MAKVKLRRLDDIHDLAFKNASIDEFDDLEEDAEQQGQLRAYVCPLAEIKIESELAIAEMAEWGVSKTVIDSLSKTLGGDLAKDNPNARGALHALFAEYDSWANYTDDYDETMQRYAWWLFFASVGLIIFSIFALRWPCTVLLGLLSSGAAGSCVSVMAKMPMPEVSPSGELELFVRQVLSRIGVGVVASLIGCALFGWGLLPIAIQGQTFGRVLNACTAFPVLPCTYLQTLILLGVPMLFGFSERALTSFEQRVFGKSV